MKDFIPVNEPQITIRDSIRVIRSLLKKEISGNSRESLDQFEVSFSEYVGCRYGVCTNSGTSAIMASLEALGVGPGDEVLVSSYTNMASFFPVLQLGAIPVPVDVDEVTFNMDPRDLETAITPNAKAIIVVHIYGHPAPMDEICEIAKLHGLFVVEDCAEAHGATYKSQPVGSFGIAACFSFYSNKIITTGEGGMVTTNNQNIAIAVRSISSLSYGNLRKFLHSNSGYNFRLSNILAALGLSQLKRIRKILKKRRKCAERYSNLLMNETRVQLPVELPQSKSSHWVYAIRLRQPHLHKLEKLIAVMRREGVECREGFLAFPNQTTVLEKYGLSVRQTPIASSLGDSTLYLPFSTNLNSRKQKIIVNKFIRALDEVEV